MIIQAKQIIAECNRIASEKIGRVISDINIQASNRMTRTYGYATIKSNRYMIKLNAKAFAKNANTNDFRILVIHEYCHLLEYEVYGTWSHGSNWKALMRMFGLVGEHAKSTLALTDAEYAEPQRKTIRYIHACSCANHAVGGKVHNKIMGGATYKCCKCGTHLSQTYYTSK